jgi:UDP-2-acetamido-3-amino-2,3-dideoxy-glucuronate N-acetyltransferase
LGRLLEITFAADASGPLATAVSTKPLNSATRYGVPAQPSDATPLIGEGSNIGAATQIQPRAWIGCNCTIGERSFIDNDVVLGDGVIIGRGVSLPGKTLIGRDVFLADRVRICEAVYIKGRLYRKPSVVATEIGEGAIFGFDSVLWRGLPVGKYAYVSPRSVVTVPVPDFALMEGAPARRTGWVCECRARLQRRIGAGLYCSACGREYGSARRSIYAKSLPAEPSHLCVAAAD